MAKKRMALALAWAVFALVGAAQPKAGDLSLNVDGTAFFQDNEFDSPLMYGYTLPGFRLIPTIEWRATDRVSIEAGASILHYWGARQYPNLTYMGIPEHDENGGSRGVHALPYLRVKIDASPGLRVVLGDIYGGRAHGLLEPLRAAELDLTADPEAGAQILYDNRWLHADAWVDWRTFIFNQSPYQENFYVGLSSTIKYTPDDAPVRVYTPLQLLAEHRGGEIDTITTHSVQTFINGAVGLGAKVAVGRRMCRSVTVEADLLGSYQQAGHTWPVDHGWALWVHGALEAGGSTLKAGYFRADNFMTIQGYAMFGIESTQTPGLCLHHPSTLTLGYSYRRQFGCCVLTAFADVYQLLPCERRTLGHLDWEHQRASTSFAFGATISFSPSFLLTNIRSSR